MKNKNYIVPAKCFISDLPDGVYVVVNDIGVSIIEIAPRSFTFLHPSGDIQTRHLNIFRMLREDIAIEYLGEL